MLRYGRHQRSATERPDIARSQYASEGPACSESPPVETSALDKCLTTTSKFSLKAAGLKSGALLDVSTSPILGIPAFPGTCSPRRSPERLYARYVLLRRDTPRIHLLLTSIPTVRTVRIRWPTIGVPDRCQRQFVMFL